MKNNICSVTPGILMMAHLHIPDIDECATNMTVCDSRAICMNTIGSFTCTCQVGYISDGRTDCGEKCPEHPHLLVVSISSSFDHCSLH